MKRKQNPAAEAANRVRDIKAWSALDVLNLIETLARTQARLPKHLCNAICRADFGAEIQGGRHE